MKRVLHVAVLAIMLIGTLSPVVAVAPASADVGDEVISPTISENTDFLGRHAVPDEVVRYGPDAHPMFIVEVADNSTSDLESWANGTDDRRLVKSLPANQHLVSAPLTEVAPSGINELLNDGLEQRSYVEDIDYNMNLAVDPVEAPDSESTFEESVPMKVTSVMVDGGFTSEGVAYSEDINKSTAEEAREVVGDTNVTAEGDNIDVAVLDTGINTANGAVFGDGTDGSTIRVDASYNAIDDTTGLSNVSDGNGHGTWVASMIAADHSNASFDGVAPNSDLYVGKVLADDGSGDTASIVRGLDWACTTSDVDVVSMSLGSPIYSEAIAEAVTDCAEEHDKTVVIATGNSRQNPAARYISSPADTDSDGVIAVGASNVEAPEDGNDRDAMSAYFSEVGPDTGADSLAATRGQGPDVAAPGTEITVKTPTEDGFVEESTLSGTSMATPVVSGSLAAGMDAGAVPQDNPAEARELVRQTTDVMPAAGQTEVGAGLVSVEDLVNEETHAVDEQADARDSDAIARDSANRALAAEGDSIVRDVLRQL